MQCLCEMFNGYWIWRNARVEIVPMHNQQSQKKSEISWSWKYGNGGESETAEPAFLHRDIVASSFFNETKNSWRKELEPDSLCPTEPFFVNVESSLPFASDVEITWSVEFSLLVKHRMVAIMDTFVAWRWKRGCEAQGFLIFLKIWLLTWNLLCFWKKEKHD